MTSLEKSIKANLNIKNEYIKNNKKPDIALFLLDQTIKYDYIGLVSFSKNDVKYWGVVTKIIKL